MNQNDIARLLFELGTLPFILLGGVHALAAVDDVFRAGLLAPVDDQARQAMTATSLRLTRRLNMWRSWLGFNISHGLGLVVFGLVLLLIALDDFQLVAQLDFLMPLAVAVSTSYLLLAIRFFFYVPALAIAFGAACFISSYALL